MKVTEVGTGSRRHVYIYTVGDADYHLPLSSMDIKSYSN